MTCPPAFQALLRPVPAHSGWPLAQIKEEIFYPEVREAIDGEALLDEAEVEHVTAKDLIGQKFQK